MPYAIAIMIQWQDKCLYKIVEVLDEPGLTFEDVFDKRKVWCITYNVPLENTIIVYSD